MVMTARLPALAHALRTPFRTPRAAFRPPVPMQSSARLFATYRPLKAASSVSGQPGSANLKDVKENAKEEIQKVTGDLAKAITGGNDPKPVGQVGGGSIEELEESVESLAGLAQTVPREAWVFGAAGFIPYVGTSLSTIYLARQASLAEQAGKDSTIDLDTALALLHHVEQIQVSYGAVILSFLGALHWGMEFAKYGGKQGSPRYLLGIVPVAIGWPTLLLPGQLALATQWAAFTGVWFLDSRATARGWTPKWYSTYRFALSIVVGSCIILTLGASGYYQTGSTGTAAGKLAAIKTSPKVEPTDHGDKASPRISGQVGGDISTEGTDEAYVKFTDEKKKAEEEEKKKEEEEKKKEEEAQQKAKEAKEKATQEAREARDKAEGRA